MRSEPYAFTTETEEKVSDIVSFACDVVCMRIRPRHIVLLRDGAIQLVMSMNHG